MFLRGKKSGSRKHRIFSRNECSKVRCPECLRELHASCMKQNGSDSDGYYETGSATDAEFTWRPDFVPEEARDRMGILGIPEKLYSPNRR